MLIENISLAHDFHFEIMHKHCILLTLPWIITLDHSFMSYHIKLLHCYIIICQIYLFTPQRLDIYFLSIIVNVKPKLP